MLITDNGKYREIGPAHPPFIVAELSSNHNQDIDIARELIFAAAEAGVDAVKFQAYTPDEMTVDPDLLAFYTKVSLPMDWLPELFGYARELSLVPFVSVFSPDTIPLLETFSCPAYKIASFEIGYPALLDAVRATGKPVFISTGMMNFADYTYLSQRFSALSTVFMYCVSNYPAKASDFNLRTIPALRDEFGFDFGISDHSEGIGVSIAAVSVGACVIEKHFTLKPIMPDFFSLTPKGMQLLVVEARSAWEALGSVDYSIRGDRYPMRSLYAIADIPRGERFASKNIGILRPNKGISPKAYNSFIDKRSSEDITFGTPLHLRHIE